MKNRLLPTSPIAKRICAIFHRKLTTAWTKREVQFFRALSPFDEEDLQLLERYYSRNWPPRTGTNCLRHDLQTCLANYPSECDRARLWAEKHPVKVNKVIPFPLEPKEPEKTEAETAEAEQHRLAQKRALAELKSRLRG